MMTNILSGQPILAILLTCSFTGITATPKTKTMKELDVSGFPPRMVETIPSERYPGGTYYTVQKNSMSRYIIGRVRDCEDVLIEGDPTAMTRYVLVHPRGDGMRYIRVTTRWRSTNKKYKTSIDEFMKSPVDAHYAPVARVPIEVDVLTQDIDQNVHVELLGDWEDHDKRPGVMPVDIETMSMKFTVQKHAMDDVVIGAVRFGHHIVDDKVDRLLEREVIWEGGVVRPIITITSRYTNGKGTEIKYELLGGGFAITNLRGIIIKLNE